MPGTGDARPAERTGMTEYTQDMLPGFEVTHLCPLDGGQVTSCCDQTPFDLPRTDRLTLDAALVNCPAIAGKNWCDPCGGWIDGQPCD
jgi:hypothetical protein